MFQLKVTQKALIIQMNLSGLCFSAYFDMDGGKDGAKTCGHFCRKSRAKRSFCRL